MSEILGSYENAIYQKCSLNYSLLDLVESSCSHIANIFPIDDKDKTTVIIKNETYINQMITETQREI